MQTMTGNMETTIVCDEKNKGFRPSTFRKSILEVSENLLYNEVRSRKRILCARGGITCKIRKRKMPQKTEL
jgi:hypothetical protein